MLWEFEAPRANDRMKDTQADAAEAQLSAFLRDQGWITQDDASIRVTGSKAVADPKPTPVPPSFGGVGTPDTNNPAADDGTNDDGSGDGDKKDPATTSSTSTSNSKPKPDAADEGQDEETDTTTSTSTSKKGKGKGK